MTKFGGGFMRQGKLTWCVAVAVVTAVAEGMLVYTLDVVKQEPK